MNNLVRVVLCFLFFLFIMIIYLMYGNCQTSKLHYLTQCYFVPSNLPKIFWVNNYIMYMEDGTVELKCYENYTGVWRKWSDVGDRTEKSYKNGELHGQSTSWDPHGVIFFQCEYYDGNMNGDYMRFDEELNILYKKKYLHGKLHGEVSYWQNGVKVYEVFYNMGKMIEGSEKSW